MRQIYTKNISPSRPHYRILVQGAFRQKENYPKQKTGHARRKEKQRLKKVNIW